MFISSLCCLLGLVCASPIAIKTLLPTVANLRGLSFQSEVKTERRKPAELEAYIKLRLTEEYGSGELDLERKTLVLFGLLPETFDYEKHVVGLLKEEVAGYYDPRKKSLYVLEGVSEDQVAPVLVHELTHALQDQHFNLEPMMKRTKGEDDRGIAINALLEGDALVVMLDYATGKSSAATTATSNYAELLHDSLVAQRNRDPDWEKTPRFLLESLLFPYVEGTNFVLALRKSGGWKAVDHAYSKFPLSSERILHPEKYLADTDIPPVIPENILKSFWPADVKPLTHNVMGEFGWRMVLREKLEEGTAGRAAAGWGGDRYWLLELASKKTALVALTIWDAAQDAREFEDAFVRLGLEGSKTIRKDRRVALQVGGGESLLKAADIGWLSL